VLETAPTGDWQGEASVRGLIFVVDASVFLALLEVEQAQRVCDDDESGSLVDKHDGADIQPEEGRDDEDNDDCEAGDEVLPDDLASRPAQPDSERDASEVVTHQRDVTG